MTSESVLEPGWAHRWREHLEQARIADEIGLRAGDAYRRNDEQLDVLVEPGRLSSVAGSERRISYEVTVFVRPLDKGARTDLWRRLARTPGVVSEVLEGRLSPGVVDQEPGSQLLPSADEVHWMCTCADLPTAEPGALCRHVAAVLGAFGHHLEHDPHDLATLRGAEPGELASSVTPATTAADDTDPRSAWAVEPAPLPPPLPTPAQPARRAPFASKPPASAPFSADGLRFLTDHAARRAWRALTAPRDMPLGFDADVDTDLARIAAESADSGTRSRLAAAVGLTAQEVAARARAWEVAGRAGVDVQRDPGERRRLDDNTEDRQGPDGLWYRFVKERGRWWLATAGRSADDVTTEQPGTTTD